MKWIFAKTLRIAVNAEVQLSSMEHEVENDLMGDLDSVLLITKLSGVSYMCLTSDDNVE